MRQVFSRFARLIVHRSGAMVFLSLVALILSACGAAPAASPTPAPTAAPAAPASIKAALIAPNRIFDQGYMELAWNGMQRAKQELGVEIKAVEVLDTNLIQNNVDDLVAQGYNVIVLVSPQLIGDAITAAKKYPEVKFIGVDHPQSETLPNLTGLIFREDHAGYLAGALAAAMTQSGKVGAVLGTDVIPQLWAFGEGFRRGALDQKADVDVTLIYHNQVPVEKSFIDPEWGRAQAIAMMDDGVDVIFAAAGATGNGALLAIADRQSEGKMGIGVDTDQFLTLPEAQSILLSSSTKQVDDGIVRLIAQVQAGSFAGGNFYGNVGLAPFHNFDATISPAVKQKLADIQSQLEQGQLQFTIPPQS